MSLCFLIIFFTCVKGQLNDCIFCNRSNICTDGKTSSLYDNNGNCIATSTVSMDDVFISGYVFGLGACRVVQYADKTGKKCFDAMATHVLQQLNIYEETSNVIVECTSNPYRSPCSYSAAKFRADTTITGLYDCAELSILYNNEVENCLRQSVDARFWFTLMYWIAVFLGIIVCIGCCCIACSGL